MNSAPTLNVDEKKSTAIELSLTQSEQMPLTEAPEISRGARKVIILRWMAKFCSWRLWVPTFSPDFIDFKIAFDLVDQVGPVIPARVQTALKRDKYANVPFCLDTVGLQLAIMTPQ